MQIIKQESPPAWTQEPYCPPSSKCLLCCLVSLRGGGFPIQSWPEGIPPPHPDLGPWPGGGGVCPIGKDGGTPRHQEGEGTTPSGRMGAPPSPPSGRMEVPPQPDGGTPPLWLIKMCVNVNVSVSVANTYDITSYKLKTLKMWTS